MTYKGDLTASINERIATGIPMGPNYLHEPMWPVAAHYDPETQTTSVEFSLIAPAGFDPALGRIPQ